MSQPQEIETQDDNQEFFDPKAATPSGSIASLYSEGGTKVGTEYHDCILINQEYYQKKYGQLGNEDETKVIASTSFPEQRNLNTSASNSSIIMTEIPIRLVRQVEELEDDVKVIQQKVNGHFSAQQQKKLTLSEVQCYLEKTKQHELEVQRVFNQMWEEVEATVDLADQRKRRRDLRDMIDSNLTNLTRILNVTMPAQPVPPQPAASTAIRHSDLPKLELPTFDGRWDEWLAFKDAFEAMVYDMPEAQMSSTKKFLYLNQALKGEALRTIKGIKVVGGNLKRAWETLERKYNNVDQLVESYLQRLDKLSPMTKNSAQQLRALFEEANTCKEALDELQHPIDDFQLISKTKRCFSQDVRNWYESLVQLAKQGGQTDKDWKKMKEFVEVRCLTLENAESSHGRTHHNQQGRSKGFSSLLTTQTKQQGQPQVQPQTGAKPKKCSWCGGSHGIRECQTIYRMSSREKFEACKKEGRCLNCLSKGHARKVCPSKEYSTCWKCKEPHHTLLHDVLKGTDQQCEEQGADSHSQVQSFHARNESEIKILPRAIVQAQQNGKKFYCHAMVDTGSEVPLITEDKVRELGLKWTPARIPVYGVNNQMTGYSKGYVDIELSADEHQDFRKAIRCLIMPEVTGKQPQQALNRDSWTHLECLKLADPDFHLPTRIDLLLDVDTTMWAYRAGRRTLEDDDPVAMYTVWGWIAGGKACSRQSAAGSQVHHTRLGPPRNLPVKPQVKEDSPHNPNQPSTNRNHPNQIETQFQIGPTEQETIVPTNCQAVKMIHTESALPQVKEQEADVKKIRINYKKWILWLLMLYPLFYSVSPFPMEISFSKWIPSSHTYPITGRLLTELSLYTVHNSSQFYFPYTHLHRGNNQQKLPQTFWQCCKSEHIQPSKWETSGRNMSRMHLNQLVILKDELQPPSKWALARAKEIHPETDSKVPRVTIQIKNGTNEQPVAALVPLNIEP